MAKTTSIDSGGGRGVRNDKVVTSNLAFARETPYISLSHCWNNIFCQIDEKWGGNNDGYQTIENIEHVICPHTAGKGESEVMGR